ncbi:MAG: Ig-like domain-containing protein, partial [Firmicutes bacterium]|nr:Ig-like domain-containing protein [Bacillota bacterium]
YYAFANMPKLTSVVFGTGLTSFNSSGPFYGDTGITDLTFTGLTVPSLSDGNTFINLSSLRTIYVPAPVYASYVAAYQSHVGPGVVFSGDTLSLSVPNLQAEKVYSRTVYLSWTRHVSPAVVKYIVRRDGVTVGETADCFFTDRNLTTGRTYTYQVYGLTADGFETSRASVGATPEAPVINGIATDNELNKVGGGKNTVYIETVNSKNYQPLGSESVTGLLYYVDGGSRSLIGEAGVFAVSSATVTYSVKWDVSYVPDGDYTVVFSLTDADGVTAEKEGTVTVVHTGPARIINVVAMGDILGINISWSMAGEIDTTRYRIYRRSEIDSGFYPLVTLSGRNTLTYRDTTVAEGRVYYYYVAGIDDLGQEGPPSEIAAGMKGTDEESPVVTKMTPASGSYINGTVSVAVTAIDNVGVTKAELYCSADAGATWELCGSRTGAPYTFALDTTRFADGVIRIRAIAYDARNNASVPLIYAYSVDNTGPEKVTGLAYTSTSVTITLSWNDVADDDIGFYRVERKNPDGVYTTVMDVNRTLGTNILSLSPGTGYTYRVVGYDRLGNRGVPSDDIAAYTQADTTAPVISSIMPKSGYFANSLALSITADDDFAVSSVAIQVSVNGTAWTAVYTAEFPDRQKKRTVTYTLDLSAYGEGALYVRGVAADSVGNVSDTGASAPYVQYIVDRTPPSAPNGVQAADRDGVVEVMWVRGPESDIAAYAVYRSASPDGVFVRLASGLASLNYFDRSATGSGVYYYKVTATDLAGNESALSTAASAQISADTEPPVIVSFYPASNAALGPGFRTVSVYATDNRMLDQIKIEYGNKTGSAYIELAVFNAVNNYEKTVSAAVPLDGFADGDTAAVRVTAVDKAGNVSAPAEAVYAVDKRAPEALSPAAGYSDGCVTLTWQSDMSADLAGYRIYRLTGTGSGVYALIGQQPAAPGRLDYAFADYSIAKTQQQYAYRIDALDGVGNVAACYTNAVTVPNRSMPVAVINCDAVMEAGVEYEIDASMSTAAAGVVG